MRTVPNDLFVYLGLFAVLFSGLIAFYTIVPQNYGPRPQKPHIIIIMADDVGRNDVGFYGSGQIPTPSIDALAYNGIILDRFYTQCSCTPSRAALLTGQYPIRLGMQGLPIRAGENKSLPLDVVTMPQYLKRLGYKTHLVGKWHLGYAHIEDTPLQRGFDSHFGYWNGFVGYFNYTAVYELANDTMVKGFDLFDGVVPAWQERGKYATDLFTHKAMKIIDEHNSEKPLFLVLAHLAGHTGEDGVELGVPDVAQAETRFSFIKNPKRRLYADIVSRLDDSVGQIVEKLDEKNLLDNSIILFLSDNGAQTIGVYENSGSNWPLRGLKLTEFEGGIRAPAAIYSPLFHQKGYVSKELIHITDFLPTFYAAAGGNLEYLGKIDGVNQWEVLSQQKPGKRDEILVNFNEIDNVSAIIMGQYKLVQGRLAFPEYGDYHGDSGRNPEDPPYNFTAVLSKNINQQNRNKIESLRNQTDLSWCRGEKNQPLIDCTEGCLFNLESDPCETTNIIQEEKIIAGKLLGRLFEFSQILVPQQVAIFDPESNPEFYNGTWCTWLDPQFCPKTI
ncbi:arylsulfatase B [Tribolium castaneum]|uniref:Arylsulfatase I-like Protein n=1 Tax=Tribolium castaneum TaxID=7070 RepID=D2A5N6_TRICA|nr:PREDICTED: arylsulfatase B [Tribolium castaneum]EFA05395.2 Arylsulfatase I-like Protein [Tribolium castaneum]|eukprot:XP_008190630.1 PREDICTED: arylsulfatase B [Tribolium castaneum]